MLNNSERFNLKNGSLGLGHTRLSIIDLSENANQPFTSNDGLVTIVFNGEIYNFNELKANLTHKYIFKTESDTEVLLNLYYEHGIECLDKLIGMFSIAIYDERENVSYLVRDRLGIKPLYYFYHNNDITFSSEIKSILDYEDYNFELNGINERMSKYTVVAEDTMSGLQGGYPDVSYGDDSDYHFQSKGPLGSEPELEDEGFTTFYGDSDSHWDAYNFSSDGSELGEDPETILEDRHRVNYGNIEEKFASKAQARYFYAKSKEPGKEGKKWKK